MPDELMPAEFMDVLKNIVNTEHMDLMQVVQVYVFQGMHFAFPEADLATWELRLIFLSWLHFSAQIHVVWIFSIILFASPGRHFRIWKRCWPRLFHP
jgi:hypothetical protein